MGVKLGPDTGLRVSENRVLKRMLEHKGEEVAGGWRRLHNEELHNLYASTYIVRVITSRRMRWTGHVACMGDMRNAYNVLVLKAEGKRGHTDDLDVEIG